MRVRILVPVYGTGVVTGFSRVQLVQELAVKLPWVLRLHKMSMRITSKGAFGVRIVSHVYNIDRIEAE
jgi:hypothetical protein